MRKVYYFLLVVLLGCISCEWQLKSFGDEDFQIVVERYDRVQSLYLTTGDFSALQQMNTVYPMQTRTLIEDVLRIGKVNDPQINKRFLLFYQDSTLQSLISEAEQQYANMEDINQDLTSAFEYLKEAIPSMVVPEVYAQIGSLDQSVIVGNNTIGICLDKYLGGRHPLYQNPAYGYKAEQLAMMNRPLSQQERDIHIGKIQWVVNRAIGRELFQTPYTQLIDRYMKNNKNITVEQMLRNNDYSDFES